MVLSVLPVAYSSYPRRRKPRAKPARPCLSLTDSRALGKALLHQPDCLRKNSMLGFVDTMPERLHRIAFEDWHGLLNQDRARIQVCGDDVHRRAGHFDSTREGALDRVHAASELGKQRGVDVDDPVLERFEKCLGVNAVIARVDDELDAMIPEKVDHRRIAVFGRAERLLRQLPQRDAHFAGEGSAPAGRPVGHHRHHLMSALDEVAQVRSLAGYRDADFQGQRITTRSGPEWRTTSPTTIAPVGTSDLSTTRIMPKPMLNVPYISSLAMRPRLRISSKIGGTSHALLSRRAPSPSGRQRGRLPRMPPPVTWAAPFHRRRPRSSR